MSEAARRLATYEDLIALATKEVAELGLVDASLVIDGTVVRMPKAYPIYDGEYRDHLDAARGFIDRVTNVHPVGRNGMHKYNNQDHAMMTALLTAENILAGKMLWDVWAVNQDAQYHEAGEDRTLAMSERMVPRPVRENAEPD